MDAQALVNKVMAVRQGRSGRRFKGAAIPAQIDAIGKPSSAHSSFNYPVGKVVKAAENILAICQQPSQ